MCVQPNQVQNCKVLKSVSKFDKFRRHFVTGEGKNFCRNASAGTASSTKTLTNSYKQNRNFPLTSQALLGLKKSQNLLTTSTQSRKMASSSSSSSASSGNRLKEERSPYLLQHAENPVHWYPWGEEAFKAAREKNKMIFLSVGYSTCHWCHVMERESFESNEVSKYTFISLNFLWVYI